MVDPLASTNRTSPSLAELAPPSLEPLADAQLRTALESRLFGVELPLVRVGRYALLEHLGSGAMGDVYGAYDDRLDRKVAIKLMRPAGESTRLRDRMLREGQTLARLSHPNVVQVYEVGVHEERMFLAMELVRGRTLRRWLEEAPRTWREILARYLEAARGLEAAHSAGLVHRDFKPDNALVGEDGRVRVLDFGLARLVFDQQEETAEHSKPSIGGAAATRPEGGGGSSSSSGALAMQLTTTGAVLGTPAYMSPEQLRGRPTDGRSDQFGFCVALFEALHGRRPFEGTSLMAIAANVLGGYITPPSRSTRVPAWVWTALRRGLAVDPSERYPSMKALIAALEHDPSRRRRRALGAGALVVGGLVLGVALSSAESPLEPCAGLGHELEALWSAEAKAAGRAAFVAAQAPDAERTWERVEARLDAYAERWGAARQDACEATHVHRTQSAEVLDLRMVCLDGRREALAALVDQLRLADGQVVERALAAASALPSLSICDDVRTLGQALHPPSSTDAAARAATLRERLARVNALVVLGKQPEARPEAEAIVQESVALDHPPVLAEARFALGRVLRRLGRLPEAEQVLLDAVDEAEASRHDELAADAWIELGQLYLDDLVELEGGRGAARRAGAAVRRLGDGETRLAGVEWLSASVAGAEQRFADAVEHHRAATRILEGLPGAEVPLGEALHRLAAALGRHGAHDEAIATHERGLALQQRVLGALHPDVAAARCDLAIVLVGAGRVDEARAQVEQAVEAWRRVYGEHSHMGRGAMLLANIALQAGDLARAREHVTTAVAIYERTLAADHPLRADADINLGAIAFWQGDLAASRAAYERAVALFRRMQEPDDAMLGLALGNLGETLVAAGHHAEALATLDEAERIMRAAPEPSRDELSRVLRSRGQAELELGEPAAAVAHLEQARAMREGLAIDPLEGAELEWSLARALHAGGDREGARARATAARERYAGLGEVGRARMDEIDAWLRVHAP